MSIDREEPEESSAKEGDRLCRLALRALLARLGHRDLAEEGTDARETNEEKKGGAADCPLARREEVVE